MKGAQDVLVSSTREDHSVVEGSEVVVEEISATDPSSLSHYEVKMLVSLLTPLTEDDLLEKALVTIQNAAAFTTNQVN